MFDHAKSSLGWVHRTDLSTQWSNHLTISLTPFTASMRKIDGMGRVGGWATYWTIGRCAASLSRRTARDQFAY